MVFQTLCKQVYWFSFAKRRLPSPVCIDDNRSCMKGWKSGFFLFDRRPITHYMSWRPLDSIVSEPNPPTAPTPEDLTAATPNSKVLAKAKYSKKGNQGEGVVTFVAEGPSTPDSRGKAVIDNVVVTSTRSVSRISSYFLLVLTMLQTLNMVLLLPLIRGELLARYKGLLKSHHEYALSADLRLKGHQQRLTSFQSLESRVSGLKKHVDDLNDKVTASDAAFVKAKAKGKEQNKKIKSLSKTLDQFTAKVACLATDLNQSERSDAQKGDQIIVAQGYLIDACSLIDGYMHSLAKKDAEILRLKPSPPEFTSFFKEKNKDWVRPMVNTSYVDMVVVASTKSTKVFVQERKKVVPLSSDILVTAGDAVVAPSGFNLLLWNSGGDSGPGLSFEKSESPERLFSLARVSLAEASKLYLSFGLSGETIPHHVPPV
nr:hypothetical protein [Tanacetum cinerariifolium]